MCDELNEQPEEGHALALALVDHLARMGAACCTIPITDRAVEYEVIVRPKQETAP